jgi:hypothetical protein
VGDHLPGLHQLVATRCLNGEKINFPGPAGWRSAANLLSRDEAQLMAADFAKLPVLLPEKIEAELVRDDGRWQ